MTISHSATGAVEPPKKMLIPSKPWDILFGVGKLGEAEVTIVTDDSMKAPLLSGVSVEPAGMARLVFEGGDFFDLISAESFIEKASGARQALLVVVDSKGKPWTSKFVDIAAHPAPAA